MHTHTPHTHPHTHMCAPIFHSIIAFVRSSFLSSSMSQPCISLFETHYDLCHVVDLPVNSSSRSFDIDFKDTQAVVSDASAKKVRIYSTGGEVHSFDTRGETGGICLAENVRSSFSVCFFAGMCVRVCLSVCVCVCVCL